LAIGQAIEDVLERVQLEGSEAFLGKLDGLSLLSKSESSWAATMGGVMLTNSLVSSSRDGGADLSSECAWPIATETRVVFGHREGTGVESNSVGTRKDSG